VAWEAKNRKNQSGKKKKSAPVLPDETGRHRANGKKLFPGLQGRERKETNGGESSATLYQLIKKFRESIEGEENCAQRGRSNKVT